MFRRVSYLLLVKDDIEKEITNMRDANKPILSLLQKYFMFIHL